MAHQLDDLTPFLQSFEPTSLIAATRARLALADFLALVATNPGNAGIVRAFDSDGGVGAAAALATSASAMDLDDVDWSGPAHPGSVIWPVVLALGAQKKVDGATVLRAGIAGYQVMWLTAKLLGTTHARHWHLTATAGAVGAAAAATVIRGDDEERITRALSFALLTLGGLGQAPLERRGSARYNRASAASQGILAATMATTAVPEPLLPWSGPRGVQAVMMADHELAAVPEDPWAALGLRIYPVNGFLQSAIRAAADISREFGPDCYTLRVELPSPVLAMVGDSSAGAWWDARFSIAQAFATRTPFINHDADHVREVDVELVAADLPVGSSRVYAAGSGWSAEREAPRWVMTDEAADWPQAREKWERTLGTDAEAVSYLTDEVLGSAPPWERLIEAWSR